MQSKKYEIDFENLNFSRNASNALKQNSGGVTMTL
jgi:hypothetical protein